MIKKFDFNIFISNLLLNLRMVFNNKEWFLTKNTRIWGYWFCWCECKLVEPLWRTVWNFFSKLNIELSYDTAMPLLGIYLEKTNLKYTCAPMFIVALSAIAKTWKPLKPGCCSDNARSLTSGPQGNSASL